MIGQKITNQIRCYNANNQYMALQITSFREDLLNRAWFFGLLAIKRVFNPILTTCQNTFDTIPPPLIKRLPTQAVMPTAHF